MTGAQPNDLWTAATCCSTSCRARPGLGHAAPGGSVDVSFGGVTIVDADDTTGVASVAGRHVPAELHDSPGGKLGALLDLQSATGPIALLPDRPRATVAQTLADSVNGVYNPGGTGTDFFTYGTGADGLPQIAPQRAGARVDDPGGGTGGPARQRRRARDRQPARRRRRPALPALVTRIGTEVAHGRAPRGQRAGPDDNRRRPPPERLRRLARRGDDEHGPLPARLPGVGARDVDDGRDARHADQPHRTGRALA